MPPYMMAYIINFAKLFFGNTLEYMVDFPFDETFLRRYE